MRRGKYCELERPWNALYYPPGWQAGSVASVRETSKTVGWAGPCHTLPGGHCPAKLCALPGHLNSAAHQRWRIQAAPSLPSRYYGGDWETIWHPPQSCSPLITRCLSARSGSLRYQSIPIPWFLPVCDPSPSLTVAVLIVWISSQCRFRDRADWVCSE